MAQHLADEIRDKDSRTQAYNKVIDRVAHLIRTADGEGAEQADAGHGSQ